jgi:polar amino acid transport system substrate-binding protein
MGKRSGFLLVVTAFIFILSPLFAQTKALRLVTFEFPPYMVLENKSAKGLTIDIVKEIFTRLGKEIKIDFYPVSRSLTMLEGGDADAMFTLKKTPEREASMLFPKETLVSQDYVFFIPKNSKFAFNGDLSSMADASIGVVDKTSYGPRFDTAVKAGKFKKIESASTFELTFKKLLGGRMDAVICSRVVGIAILKNIGGLDKVKVSGPPCETIASYLAFSRKQDNTELANNFDRIVAAMKKDGTMAKILKKYE